jgi:hypothetical protein
VEKGPHLPLHHSAIRHQAAETKKKTQMPNYNCLALITIKHFHFINHKNKVQAPQAPQANDILQALEVALISLSNQCKQR